MAATATSTELREHEVEVVVNDRACVAEGVVALTLTERHGRPLPEWSPGAHIDLLLAPDIVRQYSLCGDPADRSRWRIGVLRDPHSRGGSMQVHEQLHTGATLRVRGPRNHFSLVHAPRYLFIAGGIGVTPILTMIAAAHAQGAHWRLLYGGRTRASMAFLDDLASYPPDHITVWPEDEHGLLDLPTALHTPQPDTLIYCCGPEPLLNAVEAHATHWPPGALHIERFKVNPATATPTPGALDSFEIVLDRSGQTLTVPPDKSILEVCQQAGISTLSSCMNGLCGTCETDVLDGTPDHRDSVLSPQERQTNEFMMICVSRSLTPQLILDL